jgi:hypothetical protein
MMKLYDLFEENAGYDQDDPVHKTSDFFRGIDIAERVLDFSLEDLRFLLRRHRAGTIMVLERMGRELDFCSMDNPNLRDGSHELEVPAERKEALLRHPWVAGLCRQLAGGVRGGQD